MNILVVDDEYYIVQGVVAAIDRVKFHVENVYMAYSVEQARRILEQKEVNLLITDIEMPQENGISLMQWIHSEKPHLPVVILTGHQRFDYAYKAIQLNCQGYLLKPVNRGELEIQLQRAYDQFSEPAAAVKSPEGVIENIDFVNEVRDYILAHIGNTQLSREELAELVHLNADYFSVVFKKHFGKTLTEYLLHIRIDYAKELLLKSSQSIDTVAQTVGFSNTSYFYRKFKEVTGITPNEYRR